MEQSPSASPKAALTPPTPARVLGLLALAAALGAAGTGLNWVFRIKPMRLAAERRYRTHQGVMRLYDLQMGYYRGRGTFANDLEGLLNSSPEGAQLRELLRANADYGTLTVVGDRSRFKLEANVLDGERTLIKIRGPLGALPPPMFETR